MNNYPELNNFLSQLKLDKTNENSQEQLKQSSLDNKNKFDYQDITLRSSQYNIMDTESNFGYDKKKNKQEALKERHEMNSRLFERSINSIIPPNFSDSPSNFTKKNNNNNEFMNQKIFDRHLLFSNKNENKVFDQTPTLTRSTSANNKNKTK
jgi:hypothetical protein